MNQKTNFLVISTETEGTAAKLAVEAEGLGYPTSFYQYQQLITSGDKLPKLNINSKTIGFLEIPFTPNCIDEVFQAVYKIITQENEFGLLVNQRIYRHQSYACVEDKFYQNYFFQKNQFPRAQLFSPSALRYPIIAKKRLSSRNRNNTILRSQAELDNFLKNHQSYQYIFQKYYPLSKDYRVLVAAGQILAVLERKIIHKKLGNTRVEVSKSGELPSKIIEMCLRLAKTLKADFLGIDIGQKEAGGYFVMEYNTRAQMVISEQVLGRGLHQELVKILVNKLQSQSKKL